MTTVETRSLFDVQRAAFAVPVLPASHFSKAYKKRVNEIMTSGFRKNDNEEFSRTPSTIKPFHENFNHYRRLLRNEEARPSLLGSTGTDGGIGARTTLLSWGNEPTRRLLSEPAFSETLLRDHFTNESRLLGAVDYGIDVSVPRPMSSRAITPNAEARRHLVELSKQSEEVDVSDLSPANYEQSEIDEIRKIRKKR